MVREDLHYGSDHWPVATEVEWAREETPTRTRRAWKRTEDETINEDIGKGLDALDRVIGRLTLTAHDDIDRYTGKLIAGLLETIEITIPMAQPSQEAKSY